MGAGLPAEASRTAGDALAGLLQLSGSQESQVRHLACRNLCTCHVRADIDRVRTRLLDLAVDPDSLVPGDVIHALTNSMPAPRVAAVIHALQSRRNDRTGDPLARPQGPRPLPPDGEGIDAAH